MKVWICESGEYSDRSVVAVFTNEADANAAAAACDWDVSEWDAGEYKPTEWPAGKSPWNVMVCPDRPTRREQICAYKASTPAPVGAIEWWEPEPPGPLAERYTSARVWAADRDEALRIGADKCRAMGVEPRAR